VTSIFFICDFDMRVPSEISL